MKKIGLTGGIGSGKSTVAQLLEVIGIPVFYADREAKYLMNHSKAIMERIQNLLGEASYFNGQLNRQYVAQEVFKNPELLQGLNHIVHPAVKDYFGVWCKQYEEEALVVQEAAVLFENGGYKWFDYTILVTAPLDQRLKRVSLRDGMSKEQIKQRVENQWTDEEKVKLADFIVLNDYCHSVIEQTHHILDQI